MYMIWSYDSSMKTKYTFEDPNRIPWGLHLLGDPFCHTTASPPITLFKLRGTEYATLLLVPPIFKMQSTPHFTLFKSRGQIMPVIILPAPIYYECNFDNLVLLFHGNSVLCCNLDGVSSDMLLRIKTLEKAQKILYRDAAGFSNPGGLAVMWWA